MVSIEPREGAEQRFATFNAGSVALFLDVDGTLLDLATWSFAAVFGFFLTVVLLFYFLIGGKRIGRGLFWLVPKPFSTMPLCFVPALVKPLNARPFCAIMF